MASSTHYRPISAEDDTIGAAAYPLTSMPVNDEQEKRMIQEYTEPLMKRRRHFEGKKNYYPNTKPDTLSDVIKPAQRAKKDHELVWQFRHHKDIHTNGSKELVHSLTFGSVQVPRSFIHNSRTSDPKYILRKYILLDSNTQPNKVLSLLTRHWELNYPKLVISLISGTVPNERKMQKSLQKLQMLCVNSKAWILSDGMHKGASRMMSELFASTDDIKQIGFPKWSCLSEDKALLYGPSLKGEYDSCYFLYNELKLMSGDSHEKANPYQDVYLFEDTTEGGSLRTKVIKFLHMMAHQEHKCPILTASLVIGGKEDEECEILEQIKGSIEEKVPVIIVSDSGKIPNKAWKMFKELEMSDVIGEASVKRKNIEKVLKGMTHSNANLDKWVDIMVNRDMLTFVNMKQGQTFHPSAFIDGLCKGGDLSNYLLTALRANSNEFLRAVMTRQSMEDYKLRQPLIEADTLQNLYVKTLREDTKPMWLQTDPESSRENDKSKWKEEMAKIILGEAQDDKPMLQMIGKRIFSLTRSKYTLQYQQEYRFEASMIGFGKQIWHLFLYAILCNRQIEMVLHIGSLTKFPLGAYIFAHILYKNMQARASDLMFMGLSKTFEQNAMKTIHLAEQMIANMYQSDAAKAVKSLVHAMPFELGDHVTVLSLAGDCKAKNFMASPCCSYYIQNIWMAKPCPPEGPVSRNIIGSLSAPVCKFALDFTAYLCFVVLFSHFLLSDLMPLTRLSDVSASEWLTYAFAFGKVLEEIWQLNDLPGNQSTEDDLDGFTLFRKLYLKLKCYKCEHYISLGAMNRLDCTMLILFCISAVCRFTVPFEYFQIVRMLFCCTLILFYTRILRFLYVIKHIGPRVIAITLMLNELGKMCLILVVFIVAFGVAFQSLMSPGQPHSWNEIADLFYRPYWQMYGEIFLDDASTGMGRALGNNSCIYLKSNGYPDLHCFPSFPYILIGLYLVVSNVLLLNFVIAIFGRALTEAEDKSKVLWAYEQYVLAHEYYNKFWLPAPLNLLRLPFELFVKLKKKSSCASNCNVQYDEEKNKFVIPILKNDTKIVELKEAQYLAYLQVTSYGRSFCPKQIRG